MQEEILSHPRAPGRSHIRFLWERLFESNIDFRTIPKRDMFTTFINVLAPSLENTSLEHWTKSLVLPYNIKSLVVFIYSLFELTCLIISVAKKRFEYPSFANSFEILKHTFKYRLKC